MSDENPIPANHGAPLYEHSGSLKFGTERLVETFHEGWLCS
jgi:hypothetical protein